MSVRATDRRLTVWLVALGLLAIGSLGGCISQSYVRGLGHQAAQGALEGVADGMPAIHGPLRQALRGALVEDDTLRRAARDVTEAAVHSLEAGLASPEIRKQIDAVVVQAMESLAREGNEAVRQLLKAAEPDLKEALRKTVTESVASATSKLREGLERDVTPATERLAQHTAEQLITSLVAGLEGPLQQRLLTAGREMSKALIKGLAQGLDDPVNQSSFGSLTQLMMLQAVRGAKQGVQEGLPDERRVVLIASIVVLTALLFLSATGLSFVWWRYHQSAKSLTIMAENINQHEADALKTAIQKSAQENYVGPWLSSFLKRRGL